MTDKEKTTAEARFTATQLAVSKKYAGRADLIRALLDKNKSYTIAETEAIIKKYLEGRVG